MAQEISPVEVVVLSAGRLVVKLSGEPDPRWRKLFADYMRNSEGFGATSRKSPFEGWDTSVPGPIINVGVDEFAANYRSVVRDAAKHANLEIERGDAELAGRASAEDEAKDRDLRELDREREKAKKVTFD